MQETDEDPDTRAAFQLLRDQYSNTAEFVCELFKEPDLQIKCRIIVEAARSLHAQYISDCKIQADGQLPQLHWWAERSNGHWFKTVATILDVDMQQSCLVERFGLKPRPSFFPNMKDYGNPEVADDLSIVQKFVKVMINIAGNRCWSQMFLTLTPWHQFFH